MLESLVDLASGSAWTYVLVFGLATLDVLAPILPSESVVVAAAALAASKPADDCSDDCDPPAETPDLHTPPAWLALPRIDHQRRDQHHHHHGDHHHNQRR